MLNQTFRIALITAIAMSPALFLSPKVTADCGPHWDNSIGQPGLDSVVSSLALHDDGAGSALYAGGLFTQAGGVPAERVARWDGEQWTALGEGMNAWVYALGAFDGALYAGGTFTEADGHDVNYIARWDGAEWVPVGEGVNADQGPPAVYAFTDFDDGTGPALYVGGRFTSADGKAASYIARWDGNGWSAVGGGVNASVHALTVFDDGNGPALYAGGDFTVAGEQSASRIARWDGKQWSPLAGGGANGRVKSLVGCDAGEAPMLYAGGEFFIAGGQSAHYIARWNGSAWDSLGQGMGDVNPLPSVIALACHNEESSHALYTGGQFFSADGQPISFIAQWDGTTWSSLNDGTNWFVQSLVMNSESPALPGPALFVGGSFSQAGGETAHSVATWQLAPQSTIPADLNCDGVVDVDDLFILLAAWGECDDPDDCPADLDGNGVVDVDDLFILLANWG